jgi:hypothetical protein
MDQPMQRWCLCWRCLVSLPASHWRYHQHCTVIFSGVVCHCPCCIGIFALVVLDSSPASHPHCCQHCKLASAPSQHNRETSAYVALSPSSLLSSVVFVAVTGAVPRQLGLHVRPI